MKLERILIKIEDGKPKLSKRQKDILDKFFRQYEGQECYLELTEKKSHRSMRQHRYYWLYLTLIEEETGFTKNELHELCKGKFLTEKIKNVLGEPVRVRKSTKTLTKGEFVGYIINIENFTGIQAPDTSEYWGYTYHTL